MGTPVIGIPAPFSQIVPELAIESTVGRHPPLPRKGQGMYDKYGDKEFPSMPDYPVREWRVRVKKQHSRLGIDRSPDACGRVAFDFRRIRTVPRVQAIHVAIIRHQHSLSLSLIDGTAPKLIPYQPGRSDIGVFATRKAFFERRIINMATTAASTHFTLTNKRPENFQAMRESLQSAQRCRNRKRTARYH
jgi:hypothetical protein